MVVKLGLPYKGFSRIGYYGKISGSKREETAEG
jgi:hypothetical protein